MKASELRNKYLEFFRQKGHSIIPSASLVPANDPTVLFTTAGMHPLVPYLLGEDHPGGKRLANVQKCIRTGDIDEVGDDTHLTFFEMLGNWSLGDYFKKEAIEWSWEFLTDKKWLGIDPKYLAVSCFGGDKRVPQIPRDDESAQLWISLGVPKTRIAFLEGGVLEQEYNWWGPAGQTGPCGPDTEMFYWSEHSVEPPGTFDPEDDRWVEIWNDVFMQYNKTSDGKYEPLEQKNVDTGMGFDRMLAMMNGQRSVYDTELFKPMWDVLGLSQDIMTNDEVRKARIVLDHVRAGVFIASDGVEPSNKDRGYVLRRLLRRSMVYARLLNLKEHWLEALMGKVLDVYHEAYPELVENNERIFSVIKAEQQRFEKTLDEGLRRLNRKQSGLTDSGERYFDVSAGREAAYIHQTYGVPPEVSFDFWSSISVPFEKEKEWKEYNKAMKEHQKLSQTASAGRFKGGLADHTDDVIRLHTATHLLNAALRKVLGDNVWQKGSNITKERARFDFTHPAKMTNEEKVKVERLVNEWIQADYEVKKEILPLEEAQKLGAIGVFGEKYPDTVSVYSVWDPKSGEVISREFCGGPHVEHTGVIGKFRIKKEEASSAGIRRIKAVVEN